MPSKNEKVIDRPKQAKQNVWDSLFGKKEVYYPTLEEIATQKELSREKKHLVLWDLENIPYKEIEKIVSHLNEVNTFYCVNVKPINAKMTKKMFIYILRYGIKFRVGHNDSDAEIIRIINEKHRQYDKITIISSDTDFVPSIKKMLKHHKKVEVICSDNQKRAMLMRNNISHQNFRISTIRH